VLFLPEGRLRRDSSMADFEIESCTDMLLMDVTDPETTALVRFGAYESYTPQRWFLESDPSSMMSRFYCAPILAFCFFAAQRRNLDAD
jgi:hypothetical protein